MRVRACMCVFVRRVYIYIYIYFFGKGKNALYTQYKMQNTACTSSQIKLDSSKYKKYEHETWEKGIRIENTAEPGTST